MNDLRIINKIERSNEIQSSAGFDYLKSNFLKKATTTKINLFRDHSEFKSDFISNDIYQKILDDLIQ